MRTTRMVELTPFGAYLMPFVAAVLEAREELTKASEAYHNPVHKLLRVGFSPLVCMKTLNRVLEPYRLRHPDVSVFYKECLLDDLSERLANNMIDVVVTPGDMVTPELDRCRFYSDPLYYLPSGEGAERVARIADLSDVAIILTGGGCGLNDYMKELFEHEGASLRSYPGQAISYRVIEEWAELGIAAGILPAAKLSIGRDTAIPLQLNNGRQAEMSFAWKWRREAGAQEHVADLIEHIQATVPALVSGSAIVSSGA
jgi:DNA-binding transcriptional LysR family regulator